MPNIVQLKRSSVVNKVPDAANVEIGEPVVNLADQILYTKNTTGTVIIIGAGTTSNIAEGVNQYYTNVRVQANVTTYLAGNPTFGNVTTTGNVKAAAFIDNSNRRLLIKDSSGTVVWGN